MFDGTIKTNKKRIVTEWENQSNACYEYQCQNGTGELTVSERPNATEWISRSNGCYEYQCHNDTGNLTVNKRENATVWETQSNGCCEYQCHNDSESTYWKKCSSTEKTQRLYENEQCTDNEEMMFYVEIEVEGIDLTNLNVTEIQSTINNLTNIEADKLRIRVDINEQDEVVAVIVIVDDKTTAENIKNTINTAINEHNPKVRLFKRAEVKMKELEISSGMMSKSLIIMAMMTIIIQVY